MSIATLQGKIKMYVVLSDSIWIVCKMTLLLSPNSAARCKEHTVC